MIRDESIAFLAREKADTLRMVTGYEPLAGVSSHQKGRYQ
jgi:hypothetical protein